MLAAQPPFSSDGLKSHRRPFQPKDQFAATMNFGQPKQYVEISSSNKENDPPIYSTPVKKETTHPSLNSICEKQVKKESIDPSLADELKAMRGKLERLRSEEVRNEKALRERSLLLDLEMKEILNRGEVQKQLELEVDRLYRLNEINIACMRTSRLRSLRDKEEEKKMKLNKAYIYIQGRESLNSEAGSCMN